MDRRLLGFATYGSCPYGLVGGNDGEITTVIIKYCERNGHTQQRRLFEPIDKRYKNIA